MLALSSGRQQRGRVVAGCRVAHQLQQGGGQIAEAGLQPVDDAETARAVCTEQALLALGFGQTRRAEGWLALLGLLGDRQAALAAEFLGRTDGKGTGDLGDPLELGAWGTQLGLFTADQ